MKIGVLTYHRSHNYGACLQAYALTEWIKKNTGIDTELIDFNMKAAERFYIKEIIRGKQVGRIISNASRYAMFRSHALDGYPLSPNTLVSDSLPEFKAWIESRYDMIVVGSDEVWKLGFRGFPNPYFLPNIRVPRKAGYAISARCDFSALGTESIALLKEYIGDFDYIGVRDQATSRCLSPYVDSKKLYLNCDPTFNYDFNPDITLGKEIINSTKKTICFMFVDVNRAKEVIRRYGDKYNYISLYDSIPGVRNLCHVKPFEWIDILSASDFLVTNYFHGMCFAMKANIPFAVMEIRGGKKEDSKSYDLLLECGLEERFFMKEELASMDVICDLIDRDINRTIDFSQSVEIQKRQSESFLNYLRDAIVG